MHQKRLTIITSLGLLLVIYCLLMAIVLGFGWNAFLFAVGVLLGWMLLLADEKQLVSIYNDQPIKGETSHQPFLATRSTLFLLVMVPLAFYVISSTSLMTGKGLVMGIMLVLLVEMVKLRSQVDQFNSRFWSMVKTKLNSKQILWVIFMAVSFFLLLNFLIIVRSR